MPTGEFSFDVAFSFLGRDEPLARRLHELIAGRLRSFIYSDAERQTEIAGRDGGEALSRIYGEQARTVVVLYRESWGEAGFTAPEAAAIRNRAFEHGFEFTTFIPLDDPPTVPKWLPRMRVWFDLARHGEHGAAVLIESRVRDAGGDVHDESAVERLHRERKERDAAGEREALIDAQRRQGSRRLLRAIHEALAEMVAASRGLLQMRPQAELVVGVEQPIGSLNVEFILPPASVSKERNGDLRVAIWRGSLRELPEYPFSNPLLDQWFTLAISPTGEIGWRELRNTDAPFLTHAGVADWGLNRFLDKLEEQRRNDR